MEEGFHLLIVGGASGVGKTSVLQRLLGVQQISTGTLFKGYMALQSRDAVRTVNWAMCEDAVAKDLVASVVGLLPDHPGAIIDTHFAAKIHDRSYRIGLSKPLIFRLGRELFRAADACGRRAWISVALVAVDSRSLLNRRRGDTTRDREFSPSDCVLSLRANSGCAAEYASEFWRAELAAYDEIGQRVTSAVIENCNLDSAQDALEQIWKRNYHGKN